MSRSKGRSRSRRESERRTKSAPGPHASGADLGFRVGEWSLLFLPLVLDHIERLVAAAERERSKRTSGGSEGPNMTGMPCSAACLVTGTRRTNGTPS